MLPRPAAVCYWMVIPWLQACVPPLTGWECACPGVSAQAKLIAANFKFSNFQILQEDGCTGASRLNVLLSSTDQSLSTRPLPNMCSDHSRCYDGAFWCNTQLGECLSWSSVHSPGTVLCPMLSFRYAGATASPCRKTVPCSINMLI